MLRTLSFFTSIILTLLLVLGSHVEAAASSSCRHHQDDHLKLDDELTAQILSDTELSVAGPCLSLYGEYFYYDAFEDNWAKAFRRAINSVNEALNAEVLGKPYLESVPVQEIQIWFGNHEQHGRTGLFELQPGDTEADETDNTKKEDPGLVLSIEINHGDKSGKQAAERIAILLGAGGALWIQVHDQFHFQYHYKRVLGTTRRPLFLSLEKKDQLSPEADHQTAMNNGLVNFVDAVSAGTLSVDDTIVFANHWLRYFWNDQITLPAAAVKNQHVEVTTSTPAATGKITLLAEVDENRDDEIEAKHFNMARFKVINGETPIEIDGAHINPLLEAQAQFGLADIQYVTTLVDDKWLSDFVEERLRLLPAGKNACGGAVSFTDGRRIYMTQFVEYEAATNARHLGFGSPDIESGYDFTVVQTEQVEELASKLAGIFVTESD